MIFACFDQKTLEPVEITHSNRASLKQAIWVDLICPTPDEEKCIEEIFNLDVPTREEMREIEISSRLYKNEKSLVMTATMLAQSDTNEPKYDAVTFVLTDTQLITIRYIDPQAFKLFILRLQKLDKAHLTPSELLIELLDSTVDRIADILESIGHRLDDYSKTIFRPEYEARRMATKLDYHELMQRIGLNGEINTKARESLVTFNRLITFLGQNSASKFNTDTQLRLMTLTKDINSLSDHANFLSTNVTFLLDATLGMVNIEQNQIIKIFSVAAVIFLPPTLIASIYGMNFQMMPELSWQWGYSFALGLMAISAWLPYKFFKHKKWL
jgi:magnesium transporter